jgi:adenylyltransferase/sulfurtransferase
LQYLAGAGVGTIGIVDFDVVDLSNLQRQILYTTADIGKPKAQAAQEKLLALNSHLHIIPYPKGLHKGNALEIVREYDLVIDGSDNFATRYLVNDSCIILDLPWVFGAIFRFEGQVSVFNLRDETQEKSASYRCIFPNPPKASEIPNCSEAGVLGILPGIVGTLMANEALKIILQIGETLRNKLYLIDALTLQTRSIKIKRIEERTQITALGEYEEVCNPIQEASMNTQTINVQELKQWIDEHRLLKIIDVREEHEFEICNIVGSTLMPMSEIDDFIAQIPKAIPVVMYCHHGVRSQYTIDHLRHEYGFSNLINLTGGIHAWAMEIDEEMETY